MLIPFTTPQQKTVMRLQREYKRALALIAETMGLEEVQDIHPECIGFIVPDPPGFVPPENATPVPTAPEPTSVT